MVPTTAQHQQLRHFCPAALLVPYSSSTGSLVLELQQQVATLLAEKQQVEADRQEMAIKQGNYKGTIAQVSWQ
jgi:hypothetical protein